MDRDRLKEVHATDLTESKVNEDFVDWLKSSGPTWLMFVLIAVCVFLGVTRFRQGQATKRAMAWSELAMAQLPTSLEDVAAEYEGVGSVAVLARLQAAGALLNCVQRGVPVDASTDAAPTTTAPDASESNTLSDQDRSDYLKRATRLYDTVLEGDTNKLADTLVAVNAMFGRAAIAECQGNAEEARSWYDKAATRAGAGYPGLAAQARARMDSVTSYADSVALRSQAQIGEMQKSTAPRTNISIDEMLRTLILSTDDDEASGG